ncbi:MAG: hypothetical protein PHW04_00160 [Candidatus Wallbacteria bacterium]|nr:hypothetical protein [Candidatus Wallbacteria bacterium]
MKTEISPESVSEDQTVSEKPSFIGRELSDFFSENNAVLKVIRRTTDVSKKTGTDESGIETKPAPRGYSVEQIPTVTRYGISRQDGSLRKMWSDQDVKSLDGMVSREVKVKTGTGENDLFGNPMVDRNLNRIFNSFILFKDELASRAGIDEITVKKRETGGNFLSMEKSFRIFTMEVQTGAHDRTLRFQRGKINLDYLTSPDDDQLKIGVRKKF